MGIIPNTNADECPSPPSINLHSNSFGPLDTSNTFVTEYILRLASKVGPVRLFRAYQAGFTVAIQDPVISLCDCAKIDGKTVRGCSLYDALEIDPSISKDSCAVYAYNPYRSRQKILTLFNETICTRKPVCYTVESYSDDIIHVSQHQSIVYYIQ